MIAKNQKPKYCRQFSGVTTWIMQSGYARWKASPGLACAFGESLHSKASIVRSRTSMKLSSFGVFAFVRQKNILFRSRNVSCIFTRSMKKKFSQMAPASLRVDRGEKSLISALRMPRSVKYIFFPFLSSLSRFLEKEGTTLMIEHSSSNVM